MELYLVRHAIAFDRNPERWPDDGLRPLTPGGRRRFRLAARGARRALTAPAVVLSSPHARAWSTAQILAREAKWPAPLKCDALTGDIEAVMAALSERRDASRVALVGHEPYLSTLTTRLLGMPANEGAVIEFRKGAIAHLRLESVDQRQSPEPALPARVETMPPEEPTTVASVTGWHAVLVSLLPPRTLRRLA